MGTPGKAKALRALGAAKRRNRARIAKGEKPVIGGKSVGSSTFKKATGTSVKDVKEGGPPKQSEAKSKAEISNKWGPAAVSHGMQIGGAGYGITHGYDDEDDVDYDNSYEG